MQEVWDVPQYPCGMGVDKMRNGIRHMTGMMHDKTLLKMPTVAMRYARSRPL